MAKTYIQLTEGTDAITQPRNITAAAPFDVRSVVDTYDDLFVKSTFGLTSMYIGMMVITADTQDVYVLSKKPGSRDNDTQYRNNIQWKKVGGSEFNPEDTATKIFDSFDSLTDGSISFPYKGMIALVDGSSDADGLYILTKTPASNPTNWKKIDATISPDIPGFNFNPDGEFDPNNAPEGLLITSDKSSVVTDYLTSDNTIKDGELYTSQGINSTGEDNPLLVNVEYIDIYPTDGDGESYIRLYKGGDNWINITNPEDLGFTNITLKGGEKYEGGDVVKGDKLDFGRDVDFNGWQVKTNSGDIYTFGDEVDYDDIDIYREGNLPSAYITVNNITERILTESDKGDIVLDTIPDEDISGLFE